MKQLGLLLVVINLIWIFPGCAAFSGEKTKTFQRSKDEPPNIILLPVNGTRADFDHQPVRAYVTREGKNQKSPRFLLEVTGIRPGTRIFWSYDHESGPYNPADKLPLDPFISYENHGFNHWTDSTVADQKGESRVMVRTSCYAGDRFRFGAGFKQYAAGFRDEDAMSIRFRNAVLKTRPVTIWKRIFFENPKILKNVLFPQETWRHVVQNLETLNIECRGAFRPQIIDPSDRRIFYYFYTHPDDPSRGKGKDPRYGPEGYGPMEVMISRLNIMFSDEKKNTINILLMGAISQQRDLIKNQFPANRSLIPAQYQHRYRNSEIDMMEWRAYKTGLSMTGQSPAIVIWSDFWWLASKAIGVSHAKSLARVILHELGHHLLMFRTENQEKSLDSKGHLHPTLVTRKSMMTGSGIFRLNRRGRPTVSPNVMRIERHFINNPTWHPKIQMLIRRDYVPCEN